MTSDEFANALQFVRHAIRIVTSDPEAMSRLRMLHAETEGTLEWVQRFDPVEGYENAASRGTCPTCGKNCSLNSDDSLRRHRDTRYGNERCQFDRQLPAEIIPAVLLIAKLGDGEERGNVEGVHETGTDFL